MTTQAHLQTRSRATQRPPPPPWAGVLVSTECPPHRQSWTCTHTHTHTRSGHTQLQTQKLKIHITLSNTISLWLAPRATPSFTQGPSPRGCPAKMRAPNRLPAPTRSTQAHRSAGGSKAVFQRPFSSANLLCVSANPPTQPDGLPPLLIPQTTLWTPCSIIFRFSTWPVRYLTPRYPSGLPGVQSKPVPPASSSIQLQSPQVCPSCPLNLRTRTRAPPPPVLDGVPATPTTDPPASSVPSTLPSSQWPEKSWSRPAAHEDLSVPTALRGDAGSSRGPTARTVGSQELLGSSSCAPLPRTHPRIPEKTLQRDPAPPWPQTVPALMTGTLQSCGLGTDLPT